MKKPRNLRNKFSFSVTISFQPIRFLRVSTSWLLIPCLMSAFSHSSGTTPSSLAEAWLDEPDLQN